MLVRLDMEVWSGGRMVGVDPGVSGHRQMCDAQMAEMVSRQQIESLQSPTTPAPVFLVEGTLSPSYDPPHSLLTSGHLSSNLTSMTPLSVSIER